MEQVGGSDTSENVMQKRCSDNCPESTNKKLCQDTTTMSCPPNSAAPSEVQAENCSKQTDDVQMLDGNESATRHCSNDEVAMAEVSHDDAVSINDIPPPILLKVFSYLKIQDLLLSVSLVCKHWHNLAMDPELWRSIDIKGLLKVSDEIFGKITSLSQNVISVNLSDSKMITDAGIVQMAASCRQLRTLRMVRCQQISDVGFRAIGQYCSSLQHLYLDCCFSLTDQALSVIGAGCPKLETLDVSQCLKIQDEGIQAIARGCPLLKSLSISQCEKLTDASLEGTAAGCPLLRRLICMSCKFTAPGIKQYVSQFRHMRSLELANIPSIDDDVVAAVVPCTPDIIEFSVSLCRSVTDEGVESIARHLSKVQKLYLVSCEITDKALHHIGAGCQDLVNLDVGWCREITEAGAEYISRACPKLRTLSLVRCDLISIEFSEYLCREFPDVYFTTTWLDVQRIFKEQKKLERSLVKVESG